MHVAICVITYKRPHGLQRLLRSLETQSFEGPAPDTKVVVVDNDPLGSAGATVEEVRSRLPWPVTYIVEPRHGIPHARNKAVEAAGGCDAIAFVDDDEEPSPRWLQALLAVRHDFTAPLVAGPVLPAFEGTPPSWLLEGGLLDRPRHRTGTSLPAAGTGNLLVDGRVLQAFDDEPFDTRFATTGGTDTLFTMRAVRAGFRIVWADDAVVTEWFPSERATLRWMVRRSFRVGTGFSRCEAIVHPGLRRKARRAAVGVLRQLRGGLDVMVGMLTLRWKRVAAGLRRASSGTGMLVGLLGVRYHEYRRR